METPKTKLLILGLVAALFLAGCSSDDLGYSFSRSEEKTAVENPYSSGGGHSAGYEWAERTGGNCNGNSSSFNDGCEEYYRQINQ